MKAFRRHYTVAIFCVIIVITFHIIFTTWYRHPSSLKAFTLKTEGDRHKYYEGSSSEINTNAKSSSKRRFPPKIDKDSYKHNHLNTSETDTKKELNIKPPKVVVSNLGSAPHQTTIKDNVEAVIYSAYPEMFYPNAFPSRYTCAGTHRSITFRASPWNAAGIGDADVIFVGVEVSDKQWEEAKKVRKPHQIWVYVTGESAYFAPQVRPTDGIKPLGFGQDFRFNISITYHSKSDIVAKYGMFVPFAENDRKRDADIYPKAEDHIVAWVSSHCEKSFWNRTGFVQSLSRYLPVHKYGGCGDKRLPFPNGPNEPHTLLKGYKFYLAFENSCCSEYITEKFWQALTLFKAVPIVIGASKSEYERVAPPNSFVFANDFSNVEDLARFILKVANDEKLYNLYHEWRKYGQTNERQLKGQIYPFTSHYSACIFLKFLEQNAWKENNKPLLTKLDPFGPEWLGSCKPCGDKKWINDFDLSSDGYNPIVYMHSTFYKYTSMNEVPYTSNVSNPKLV